LFNKTNTVNHIKAYDEKCLDFNTKLVYYKKMNRKQTEFHLEEIFIEPNQNIIINSKEDLEGDVKLLKNKLNFSNIFLN
jgi:hypothetical protein